jgi:hypothetical protein
MKRPKDHETIHSVCPICLGYMLNYQHLAGWKKCSNCGYCHETGKEEEQYKKYLEKMKNENK